VAVEPKRVAIVHEHEIVHRGLSACLGDEASVEVVHEVGSDSSGVHVDVAVLSSRGLLEWTADCALVVCADEHEPRSFEDARVLAVLPLATLSCEQLVAAVHAAAAGLRVEPERPPGPAPDRLDERRLSVLRLLAEGASTRAIADKLSYSERTVKALIYEIQSELGASTRAQAVAEALRLGLI
jgi:DNA-binding NarL/FixJ family response regulator